jgi:hypothetical protein
VGLSALHHVLVRSAWNFHYDAFDPLVRRRSTKGAKMKKGYWHVIAIVIAGIAGLDLLFGNLPTGTNSTGQQTTGVLPTFLTNILTTQWDLILIAIAGVIFWMV